MIIRPETPRDIAAIYRVITDAFGQSDEADLVKALRNAGDAIVSLVAEEDGEIVGHVLLSKMEAPFRALALAPLAVAPDRHRSGVGSALARDALQRVREAGWDAVFVLGDPGYYSRFGFSAEAARGFRSPYAGAHFMLLARKPGPLATTGDLHHAPAFAALG